MKTAEQYATLTQERSFQETFIPTRYPYTYAYDYMRSNVSRVIPAFIDLSDVTFSRGGMAGVSHIWANHEGIDRIELVTTLANAYLINASIEIPEEAPKSQREILVSTSTEPDLPEVHIQVKGERTSNFVHITEAEAQDLYLKLAEHLMSIKKISE